MNKEIKYGGLKVVPIDKGCIISTFKEAARRINKIKNIVIIMEYKECSTDRYYRAGISSYSESKETIKVIEKYRKALE